MHGNWHGNYKYQAIDLADGTDAMTPGPRSIISFYDDLILLCYRNKGRWTTYGNIIDRKFIRGLEERRNELESRLL